MKHTLNIILGGLFLLISYSINAQVNILDKEKYLLINDSIKIQREVLLQLINHINLTLFPFNSNRALI